MFRFIYWLIAFIMFAGVVVLVIMEDEFSEELINAIKSIDCFKMSIPGLLLIYQLVFAMMSICWPLTLILAGIMYLSLKESE